MVYGQQSLKWNCVIMETKDGFEYQQNYDFVVKLLAKVLCGRSIDFIGVEIGLPYERAELMS